MSYTDEQQAEIQQRLFRYEKTGQPEKAQRLKAQVEEDMDFSELMGTPQDIQEEIDTAPEPPRNGPGSGIEAWQSFAKLVTDMSDETIDNMNRGEIIQTLEDGDYITSEDPTGSTEEDDS